MSPEPLRVAAREEGGAWVLSLPPRLEAHVEDALIPAMEAALAGTPRRIVLDFTAVGFASSAGIGAVVDALRRGSARSVPVCLACLVGQPRLVMERIGLTRISVTYDSVADALAGGLAE
jgi:anti-anti-sigma factor